MGNNDFVEFYDSQLKLETRNDNTKIKTKK